MPGDRLAGADTEAILQAAADFEAAGDAQFADQPTDLYGDGHSAERIVEILAQAKDD